MNSRGAIFRTPYRRPEPELSHAGCTGHSLDHQHIGVHALENITEQGVTGDGGAGIVQQLIIYRILGRHSSRGGALSAAALPGSACSLRLRADKGMEIQGTGNGGADCLRNISSPAEVALIHTAVPGCISGGFVWYPMPGT